MTKAQEKNIERLIELRKKAGERLMKYDSELSDAFMELGINLFDIEGGTNSVFLITEPDYCKKCALKLLYEKEIGGTE